MVKHWLIYLSLLLVSGWMNRWHGGFATSLIFWFFLFLPVFSFLHVLASYLSFRFGHKINHKTLYKNDVIHYQMTLVNPLPMVLAPFKVDLLYPDLIFKKEDQTIPTGSILVKEKETKTMDLYLTCRYCGSYQLGVDQLVFTDSLGMFKLIYSDIEKHKVLIYPRILPFNGFLLKRTISDDADMSMTKDFVHQDHLIDIRDYQPGDSFNKIHWKLTAKQNAFLTREYGGQETGKTFLFIDTCLQHQEEEKNIVLKDTLLETGVSIAHHLLKAQTDMTLFWERLGRHMEAANHMKGFSKVYEAISHIDFSYDLDYGDFIKETMLETRQKGHLIILVSQLTPSILEAIINLQKKQYEVTCLLYNQAGPEDAPYLMELITKQIRCAFICLDEDALHLEVVS